MITNNTALVGGGAFGWCAMPRRGSVIAITLMVIIVLSLIGVSVLKFSLSTYALGIRNNRRMAAEGLAESELEMMYYNWHARMVAGMAPADAVNALTNAAVMGDCAADAAPRAVDVFSAAVTSHPAFNLSQRVGGWTVRRSFGVIAPVVGQLPGNAKKTGTLSYFTAGVIVTGTRPNAGIEYRLGRRFVMSTTSIFQFAIFYPAQIGARMENRAELIGIGLIEAVEIMLDHGFD